MVSELEQLRAHTSEALRAMAEECRRLRAERDEVRLALGEVLLSEAGDDAAKAVRQLLSDIERLAIERDDLNATRRRR